MRLAALFFALAPGLAAATASDVARQIREVELDPAQCYRARDLFLARDEARFYFTEGYIIFSKPVDGRRVAAVYSGDTDGGDAEVLMLPPNRGERASLAAFAGSPNLSEHFSAAIFVFSDRADEELLRQIGKSPASKPVPEMGVLLAQKWSPTLRNITTSFETRLVWDWLSGATAETGLFSATLSGRNLGTIDIAFDPRASEQLVAGQLNSRDGKPVFDFWSSFTSRSFRDGKRAASGPEFDISSVSIDSTISPALAAQSTTRLTISTKTPLAVLPFEVSRDVRIKSVTVDGKPGDLFIRDSLRSNLMSSSENDVFLVIPSEPVVPGREHRVEFAHEGSFILRAGDRVFFMRSRSNWYPSRGMQFSRYELTFRYPKNLDLVATGSIVSDKTEGDVRLTVRRAEVPVRLAGFNVGIYDRVRASGPNGNVELCANRESPLQAESRVRDNIQLPPSLIRTRRPGGLTAPPLLAQPDPMMRWNLMASRVSSALEYFATHFGPPPLKDLTVAPIPGPFGQGFPGLIYLSTLAYLDPESRPAAQLDKRVRTFFSETLQAHETAHQWWGNVVTAAAYHDEWMLEALASYSALLFLEKQHGAKALVSVLDEYQSNLLAKTETGKTVESTGPIVLGSRLGTSQTPQAWRAITYEKGSWIFHMLRRRLGDQRFLKMLGELVRRYERKPLSTEDLRLAAASFLPPGSPDPKLESFFDQWVYGTGVPSLEVKYSVRGKSPNLQLTGTITQKDVGDDFSVAVPLEVQTAPGKTTTLLVRTSDEPATFTVPVSVASPKVQIDPQRTVLAHYSR